MDRLFPLFLFAAFLYQLIRGDYAAHQALATELARSNAHRKAKEDFDD
jgi:hypothetical protein